MPQFDFNTVFLPQLVWLAVFFAILYFAIVGPTLPKLSKVMAAREEAVSADIGAAEAAKAEADRIGTAHEAEMTDARERARQAVDEARSSAARDIEARLAEAGRALDAQQEQAASSIGEARDKALAEIESVAADAAADIVELLTGTRPDDHAAREAAAAA